jgi:TolA-binding protein
MLSRGKHEQAVTEYQSYEEAFPKSPALGEAVKGKGWALFRLARYPEAAETFAKAADLLTNVEEKAECRFKVADSLFSNGQYDQAMKTYESIAASPETDVFAPKALFQVGECHARTGNRAGALEAFGRLVNSHPDSSEAGLGRLRMGEVLRLERRWAEAVLAYDEVMCAGTNSPHYAEALQGRGMVRYQLFQFSEALRDFEEVWTAFPSNAAAEQAFYMRGMCSYWMGEDARALSIWDDFTGRFPSSEWAPDVLFWKARFRFNRGDYAEAQDDFVSFADEYPSHQMADDALLWGGKAASKRKEFVKANQFLTRMLESYPGSDKRAEARFSQADALWELARYSEAILICDEIIGKYPDSDLIPQTWGRKGDCQFTLGVDDPKRYRESMESYRVVAGRADAPPDLVLQAEYKIGRCLEKLDRTDDAFKQYYMNVVVKFLADREKGVWQNENAKVWFTRAAFNAVDILEARQEWSKAVRILERVVESGVPATPAAQERLKRIKTEHWWLFR